MAKDRITAFRQYPAVQVELLEKPAVAPQQQLPALLPLTITELPRLYRIAKRALDVTVSALVLALLSPVLLLTALLVRLTTPGPALFRQERVGMGGRAFTMYKFRSMYDQADHTLHELAYIQFVSGEGGDGKVGRDVLALVGVDRDDDLLPADAPTADMPLPRCVRLWLRAVLSPVDPRVTAVGHVLRMTSIDELPQFYNVLIGDMSLVGPRPPIAYEVQHYASEHLVRLTAQPGITGIWQVYGRNRVKFHRMVEMDIEYIEQRSFLLDLKLLVLTLPSMLLHRSGK